MTEGPLYTKSRALDVLLQFPLNEKKVAERRTLLLERPELRLQVNTDPLRSIIDYSAFKCNPRCSIARNDAIEGSDVDGGLVVLREETPIESQLAFIEELRTQGFDVYHPTEEEALRKQLAEAYGTVPRANILDLSHRAYIAESNQIRFIPESVLVSQGSTLGSAYEVYIKGFDIN